MAESVIKMERSSIVIDGTSGIVFNDDTIPSEDRVSTNLNLYKIGNICFLKCGGLKTTKGPWQTFITLPQGFRPSTSVYSIAMSGSTPCGIFIGDTNYGSVQWSGSRTTSDKLAFYLVYYTD